MATIRFGKDRRAPAWNIDQKVSPTQYLLSILGRDGHTRHYAGCEEVDGHWYFYRRDDSGRRPLTTRRLPIVCWQEED